MTICAETFSIAGLVLNLAGVVMLFRYGMPWRVVHGGQDRVIVPSDDPVEAAKDRHYRRLGWVGLTLIVLGTLTQIAAIY